MFTPHPSFLLGRKPDTHDPRDLIWRASSFMLEKARAKALPTAIDNCAGLDMPAIFQQEAGDCTANAGIRWFRWLALKHPTLVPNPLADLSRQAQYAWERMLPWNNDLDEDAGANTRDIFRVLQVTGTCPEADDPYSLTTLYLAPSAQAVADAYHRRIGPYFRIISVDDLKIMLASGQCGTIGFSTTEAVYWSLANLGPDGIWNPPLTVAAFVGGHEVFMRGYDDSVNGGSFFCDNSWGAAWGKAGSFYMPYAFLEDYAVSAWDSWTGHLKNE